MVLIYMKTRPIFTVDIEVWTNTTRSPPYNIRNSPLSQLICTQYLFVEHNVVHGGPLRLDFELLMRCPPQSPLEHDVVFTEQDVLTIASQCE